MRFLLTFNEHFIIKVCVIQVDIKSEDVMLNYDVRQKFFKEFCDYLGLDETHNASWNEISYEASLKLLESGDDIEDDWYTMDSPPWVAVSFGWGEDV